MKPQWLPAALCGGAACILGACARAPSPASDVPSASPLAPPMTRPASSRPEPTVMPGQALAEPIPPPEGAWTMFFMEPEEFLGAGVNGVAPASDGSIWFGLSEGVVRFDGETWLSYSRSHGLPKGEVVGIAAAPDGGIWVGADEGLARFDGRDWTRIPLVGAPETVIIRCLTVTSDGALWVGTVRDGAWRFDGAAWKQFTTADGLADDDILAIAQAPDGALWFGTSFSGVSYFDGETWHTYTQEDGLFDNTVSSIVLDTEGTLWLGHAHGASPTAGLTRFQDGLFSTSVGAGLDLGNPGVPVVLAAAHDGGVWLSADGGIWRYDGSGWRSITDQLAGERPEVVAAMATTRDGVLWLGSWDGRVYSYDPGEAQDGNAQMARGPEPFQLRPIARLSPTRRLRLDSIQMTTVLAGWGTTEDSDGNDHVLHTVDGGLTWMEVTPTELLAVWDFQETRLVGAYLDEVRAWVTTPDRGKVWRTSDAGATWRAGQAGYVHAPAARLTFIDPQHGWLLKSLEAGFGTERVALFRTSDGGASWKQVVDPSEGDDLQSCFKTGIAFGGPEVGVVTLDCQGGTINTLWDLTGDGGLTWNENSLPTSSMPFDQSVNHSCISDSPRIFTSTSGVMRVSCLDGVGAGESAREFLFRTDDAGVSWQVVEYPGGAPLFLDDRLGWALGRDIFQTVDGGASWGHVKTVYWDGQFSFVDREHGWAVAVSGEEVALVRTMDGGRTWEQIQSRLIAP